MYPSEAESNLAAQEISRLFLNPKSSLLCSQDPVTGSISQPVECRLHLTHYLFRLIHFNIVEKNIRT
jgi:hypothetical protein